MVLEEVCVVVAEVNMIPFASGQKTSETRTADENASENGVVILTAYGLTLSWRWIGTVFLSGIAMKNPCSSAQH
jgi:hypothetical protein